MTGTAHTRPPGSTDCGRIAARGPTGPRKTRRFVRLAVFLAIQPALIFLLIEVGGRIFDPIGVSYYPETARYLDTLVQEDPIGYRNRPDLTGEFWGHEVSINSLGMRDREVPGKADDGEFRIMILGDSFPFGLGVGDDESVPYRLEVQLNERYGGAPRFRTLNMGAPSYNTEQELIQLETLGKSLHPDLVVLFYSVNDIQPKMWVIDKRRPILANLAQRSYAASLLTVLYRQVRIKLSGRDARVKAGEYTADHPRWLAVERSLRGIASLCEEAGIPFVVVTQIRDNEAVLSRFRDVERRLGVARVNLLPGDDPRWRELPPLALENSPVDSHPNRDGCEVYATLTREALERLGLIPGAAPATESSRDGLEQLQDQ